MTASSTAQRRFRALDRVRVPYGGRKVLGTVIDDLGSVGKDGEQVYRVEIYHDPGEPSIHHFSADQIEKAADQEFHPHDLDKSAVMEYLIHGGLMSILRTNTGGRPPAVWLCLDNRGEVTHTFIPERGVVGGSAAPFFAYHHDRVFTPRKNEVLQFLNSFGLSPDEAHSVVEAVGSAP